MSLKKELVKEESSVIEVVAEELMDVEVVARVSEEEVMDVEVHEKVSNDEDTEENSSDDEDTEEEVSDDEDTGKKPRNKQTQKRKKRTPKMIAMGAAKLPELRDFAEAETEYQDFPEEQIWQPEEGMDDSMSNYILVARAVLTCVQIHRGIEINTALENACTGSADQYISDTLHKSQYIPFYAYKNIVLQELPRKLIEQWTKSDVVLFQQGLARHGKNFHKIRRNFLPMKSTMDLVEFYYTWKWTEEGSLFGNSRSRSKRRAAAAKLRYKLSSEKIRTRSATGSLKKSRPKSTIVATKTRKTQPARSSKRRTSRAVKK